MSVYSTMSLTSFKLSIIFFTLLTFMPSSTLFSHLIMIYQFLGVGVEVDPVQYYEIQSTEGDPAPFLPLNNNCKVSVLVWDGTTPGSMKESTAYSQLNLQNMMVLHNSRYNYLKKPVMCCNMK